MKSWKRARKNNMCVNKKIIINLFIYGDCLKIFKTFTITYI